MNSLNLQRPTKAKPYIMPEPAVELTPWQIKEDVPLLFKMTTRRGETIDYATACARLDAAYGKGRGTVAYD